MIASSPLRVLGLAFLGLALKISPIVAQTETSFPFRLVWRFQIEEGRDRKPNNAEIAGVVDATVEWFEDVLPTKGSFLDSADSLSKVTAVVDSFTWDPNRSQPHNVLLDVTFVVRGAAPGTTARQLMEDIKRADRSVFVTDYLRESGPASSVYQWTLDTATWMFQETITPDSPTTTTSASSPQTSSTSTTPSGGRQPSTPQSGQTPHANTMASTAQGQAQAQSQLLQPQTQTQNGLASTGGNPTGSTVSLPFLLVWRLQVLPEEDRKPTSAEVRGVADATVEWFEDTLPTKDSFLDAATSLTKVTATVLSDEWDSTKTQQHDIRLDVTFTVKGASPETTARQLMEDIKSADRSKFVTLYLRESGPEDSLYQWTMDTATWMIQESVIVDSPATSATPSTQSQTGSIAATPSGQSQTNPMASTSTTPAGQSQTGSSTSATPSGQNPHTNSMASTQTQTQPQAHLAPPSTGGNPTASTLSLPLLVVWRLQVEEAHDRKPKFLEVSGVADATAAWLQDVLPTKDSFKDDAASLTKVTATVLSDDWDPSKTQQHNIRLDVTLHVAGASPGATARQLMADIYRADRSNFVTSYLRESSPSNSIYQRTMDTATWMLQETTTTNGPTTTSSVQSSQANTKSSTTEALTVTSRNPSDTIVSFTSPVILKFGGIPSDIDSELNEIELAGLLETTTEFLEDAVLEHYAGDSDGAAFVALALEWTEAEYTAAASLYPHILMVDVIMFYNGEVPSKSEYYYGTLLNNIFSSNSSDYLVSYVHESGPSDNIFRLAEKFDWDFPF